MKMIMIMIMALAPMAPVLWGSNAITVTKPANGSKWTVGGIYQITWSATTLSKKQMNIDLMQGAKSVLSIAKGIGNTGTYQWKIPATVRTGEYQISVSTSDNKFTAKSGLLVIIASGAGNGAGTTSSLDDTATESQAAQQTAPSSPTNLIARAQSVNTIILTWTDAAQDETGYKIERSVSSGSGFAVIASLPANKNSFTSTGLAANTTYFFRVRAYRNSLYSGYSGTASISTLPEPPLAPMNLAANASSSNSISLTWIKSSGNSTETKIERSVSANSGFAEIGRVPAGTQSYSAAGLNPGIVYYFRIRASGAGGNSAYSAIVTATTTAAPVAPAAPTNLAASPGQNASSVKLAWTNNASANANFKIEKSATAGSGFAECGTAVSTTAYVTGLIPGTYYFRVRAYANAGISGYSNTVSYTLTSMTAIKQWGGTVITPYKTEKLVTGTVTASGGRVQGVTVTKTSGPSWIEVAQTALGDIEAGASKTFTVKIRPGLAGTALPALEIEENIPFAVQVKNSSGASGAVTLDGLARVPAGTPLFSESTWNAEIFSGQVSASKTLTVTASGGPLMNLNIVRDSARDWMKTSYATVPDIIYPGGTPWSWSIRLEPPAAERPASIPYKLSLVTKTGSTTALEGTVILKEPGFAIAPLSFNVENLVYSQEQALATTITVTGAKVRNVTFVIEGPDWITFPGNARIVGPQDWDLFGNGVYPGPRVTFRFTQPVRGGSYPYKVKVTWGASSAHSAEIAGTVIVPNASMRIDPVSKNDYYVLNVNMTRPVGYPVKVYSSGNAIGGLKMVSFNGPSWVTVTNPANTIVVVGDSQQAFNISINPPPAGTSVGRYSYTLVIGSNNGSPETITHTGSFQLKIP